MEQQKNLDHALFDPPLISTKTIEAIERERQNPEFLDIGLFDSQFVMARKSKVVGLLGDTSQGKTSLMIHIAREISKTLKGNDIGLYVTWEDNVEDFGIVDIANVSKIPVKNLYSGQIQDYEFSRMLNAAGKRAALPLWIAGHSETSEERPMLTMSDVFSICSNIVHTQGKNIRFIMLDYLQRINRRDTKEKESRLQFSAVMDQVKNLALTYKTCVFIGSQVRRDMVEKAGENRQPQAHWAMETSNFEHSCDGLLSVWMPYMSKDKYKPGDTLPSSVSGETTIKVSRELIVIEILKQKKGGTGTKTFMDFIFEYGMFVKYGTATQERSKIISEIKNER